MNRNQRRYIEKNHLKQTDMEMAEHIGVEPGEIWQHRKKYRLFSDAEIGKMRRNKALIAGGSVLALAAIVDTYYELTGGGIVSRLLQDGGDEQVPAETSYNSPEHYNNTISYDAAKRAALSGNPEEAIIVQKYLDGILENKAMHGKGIDAWKSFKGFIYDHEFEKMAGEFRKDGLEMEMNMSNAEYVDLKKAGSKGGLNMAVVPFLGPNVYIGSKAFDNAGTQEEFLSSLDNEAYHVGLNETGWVHLYLNMGMPDDKELRMIMNELFSFDLQFKQIILRRRKVSGGYIMRAAKPSRVLFKELEKIAEEDSPRSEDARVIYNLILAQPTFDFFVPRAERSSKKPYILKK